MPKAPHPAAIIAAKDMSDATRDRFIAVLTVFLVLAALVSLLAGAIALATDVATYENAKATLLALGKSAAAIAAPEPPDEPPAVRVKSCGLWQAP